MPFRPGAELAARPLHFIWICDCSGSMSQHGKIDALNNAIRAAIPPMKIVADENPNARVLVRAVKFSHGSSWHVGEPTPISEFHWADLEADQLQKTAVDVIFLVDTSGSMSDEIEAVKRSCIGFAGKIEEKGADVRLGLVAFDIGGHRGGRSDLPYTVHQLSEYTIGIWQLTSPNKFSKHIESLKVGLFGGAGCYLADDDTVDIFPHVIRTFGESANRKVLVIISDEMGQNSGLDKIVESLRRSAVTTYVLGVPGENGAHFQLAQRTGGEFWDITATGGQVSFGALLETVSQTIARELSKTLSDGSLSAGTDMGKALSLVAKEMKMPPMEHRGLPPVLVLVSDGQPTDDFDTGLSELMAEGWGKKSARIAIGIGSDADANVLQRFIGHPEIRPLQANNSEALTHYIRWVSTAVLKSASRPNSQVAGTPGGLNVPIPKVLDFKVEDDNIW